MLGLVFETIDSLLGLSTLKNEKKMSPHYMTKFKGFRVRG